MNRALVRSILLCAFLLQIAAHAQLAVEKLRTAFPGKNWSVVIDSPGFVMEADGLQPGGRQYLLAKNGSNGMTLSVSMERSSKGADPNTCPAYLRKRVEALKGLGLQDVQYFAEGSMSIAEYLIPEVKGLKIRQKHMVACTAREDVYVDVHLSKTQFREEDEPLFRSLLSAVSIVEAQPAKTVDANAVQVRELVGSGSRYYLQQSYKEAIPPYQQALNLEKKRRTLEKDLWRVLVDNLGMAYGITGDLVRAEETFRYGAFEDPTYPMFWYNLACVYGERNDLDTAAEYLKKAFSYKANVIPGEKIPDPRGDDSFRRFLASPKFQALMKTLDLPSSK